MNPVTLAKFLGHSSLNMIQRTYAHITPYDAYEWMMTYLTD
jgi:integrase